MEMSNIQLEGLPSHILEEIFLYFGDIKFLRQVCKYFKDVIDNSPKLMQKYALNVTGSVMCYSSNFSSNFQELKFECLSPNEYEFVINYPYKDKIKTINIVVCDNEKIRRSISMIQYIILNFCNLEEFYFTRKCVEQDYNCTCSNCDHVAQYGIHRFQLIGRPNSKLFSLTINGEIDVRFILRVFSNIKSIKILNIKRDNMITFPDVSWALEEIRINTDFRPFERNTVEFLECHKKSLKILEILDLDVCNFIMKELPNLEKVAIYIADTMRLDDRFLMTNQTTKELALIINNENIVEGILKHYIYIEKLHLAQFSENKVTFGNIKFPNLRCLSIVKDPFNIIVNGSFPELKRLDLAKSYNANDLNDIPGRNLVNIERLSIGKVHDIEFYIPMLQKCQSLRHLNIEEFQGTESEFYAAIKKILVAVPQLKYLGLLQKYLDQKEISCREILSNVENTNLIIRVYAEYHSMFYGFWNFGTRNSKCFYRYIDFISTCTYGRSF